MSVQLRPMTDEEFEVWHPKMLAGYVDHMSGEGGMDAGEAEATAASQMESLFPGGKQSDAQLVYVLEADGEPVGHLWVCDRDDPFQHALFVYFVGIDEAHRGKGYGKAAMQLAEEEARRLGIDKIALNVFGRNEVARNLYRSLGYEENAIAMSKRLS